MADEHTLGDGPVQPEYHEQMKRLARLVDEFFNGDLRGHDRKTGFVLMVFPFHHDGRCNYISNADRADIVTLLKEQIARFEGQPELAGKA